ncbi:MAG: hypothetical protein Rubg2KO_30140 [Rubricoccaceae bacterium]
MEKFDRHALVAALDAVGDLLYERGHTAKVLVVGGAALVLRGLVERTTVDVDVLALLYESGLSHPDPFPPHIQEIVETVANEYGYASDWMNGHAARLWNDVWPEGLPEQLQKGVIWKTYGGLQVGLVGREALVALKVYAVVNGDSRQTVIETGQLATDANTLRHLNDLTRLAPSDAELAEAKLWLEEQNQGQSFLRALEAVLRHVQGT